MEKIVLDEEKQKILDDNTINELDIKLEALEKERKTKISNIIFITLLSIFGLASVILPFFLTSIKFHWICIASAVFLAGLIVGIILFSKKKIKLVKLLIVGFVFVLIVEIVYIIVEQTGFINTIKDQDKFQAFIKSAGPWMVPAFIALQFLQVIILPIPSAVSTVAGGVLFGPFLGSLYSLIGIIPASLVAFLIGRYAGYELVLWIVGKDAFVSALKLIRGKDIAVLTLMFFLPVFPDDVLCFVAGLSSMNIWYFLSMIAISRAIQVFTTSYFMVGGLIPFNTWWGLLIWGIILAVIVLLFYISIKKGDKIEDWILSKFSKKKENAEPKPDFTDKILKQIETKEAKKRVKFIKQIRLANMDLYLQRQRNLKSEVVEKSPVC